MIRSMTGFGSASVQSALGEIGVEVKSLNNRFLDITMRLPKELGMLEPDLREEVKQFVGRGKVELLVRWTPMSGSQPLYEINRPLLKHYAQQVREVLWRGACAEPQIDLGALFALPGVVIPSKTASNTGPIRKAALKAARAALKALDRAREAEGKALVDAIRIHLDRLDAGRAEIADAKDELIEAYRERLRERFAAFEQLAGGAIDPARFEAEVLMFVDKSDISEELVRLEAHLQAFGKQCEDDSPEPVGKFMDFLVQELLREVNTTGNKARGLKVAQRIVQMKSEIEKIREQVQNLE
jgi:uncharacterized protein (TIGR00255 family)